MRCKTLLALSAVVLQSCAQEPDRSPELVLSAESLMAMPMRACVTSVIGCTEQCHCYWGSDCGPDAPCLIGGCQPVWDGKLDGVCRGFRGPGAGWAILGGNVVGLARSADRWFQSYIAAAQDAMRMPDSASLVEALRVPLTLGWHREIRQAVYNSIDLTMGFDFQPPEGDCFAYDPRCIGRFRVELSTEGVQLLEALRQGFTQAIRESQPSAVEEPLRAFWNSNSLAPLHTGRCYPHGHPDFQYRSPADCQVDGLTRILKVLLAEIP